MKTQELLKNYVEQGTVMQLATVANDKPWICTVYYVADEGMNIYWLSFPSRRHSREIAENAHVAITIPVKFDTPVIGVQAEGSASVVNDLDTILTVMKQYTQKYDVGHDFYDNFMNGTNQHHLYKFIPKTFVLFDEVNFPEQGRLEITI